MTMSDWERHGMSDKIRAILGTVQADPPDHHFRRPFLTAYQIAIEFSDRYTQEFTEIDLPIGGAGTNDNSLAQYIARELSRRLLHTHELDDIEGAFISNRQLEEMTFLDHEDRRVVNSCTTVQDYGPSMYRLRRANI